MKHIFIINPVSGKGAAKKTMIHIEEICQMLQCDYDIIVTSGPKDATRIASQYNEKDNVCMYAVGGDGTVLETLLGLNENVPMGIIPAGTGNDFYRSVYSEKKDIKKIIKETIQGKIVQIDKGIANHSSFLNCMTFGMDAQVNELVVKIMKKTPIPKGLVYILAAFWTVLRPNTTHVILETEFEKIETDAMIVAIMNGQYYGGGFHPTPMASLQDGYFDCCIVDKIPFYKLIGILPKFFAGKHINLPQCHFYKFQNCKLICPQEKVYSQIDGEPKNEKEVMLSCQTGKLLLRVPSQSKLK